MEMADSIHLCCPPAHAMVGDYWECHCTSAWLYVHDMGARIPDWIRIGVSR